MTPIAGRHEWISAAIVRDVAHAAGSTWRRLVTDPLTGHLLDLSTEAYEVPARLRRQVIARDQVSRVPGSTRPAGACDMDHDIDYADGGTTSEENISPKHRRGHNHKTRHTWHCDREPHPDGAITWTTPTGRRYTTTPWDYRDPDPPDPDELLENLAGTPATATTTGAGPGPGPGAGVDHPHDGPQDTHAGTSEPGRIQSAPPDQVVHRIHRCPDCRRTHHVDMITVRDLDDDPIRVHLPPRPRRRPDRPTDPWTNPDPGPPPF
ncbi:HNH endonuclease signature motif containing protein [Mobilicoccus caccae]|nr:HNH endonuclease signature motif containing protein [Mobilicoccus caccae]